MITSLEILLQNAVASFLSVSSPFHSNTESFNRLLRIPFSCRSIKMTPESIGSEEKETTLSVVHR